jgi:hypothetical protein
LGALVVAVGLHERAAGWNAAEGLMLSRWYQQFNPSIFNNL